MGSRICCILDAIPAPVVVAVAGLKTFLLDDFVHQHLMALPNGVAADATTALNTDYATFSQPGIVAVATLCRCCSYNDGPCRFL
jgi:hypothetical protein